MSAPETSWVPVFAALAGSVVTGVIQYFMSRQNHANTLEREEKAAAIRMHNEKQVSEEKLRRERYFIATELVLMLETFAADCSDAAVSGIDMHGLILPHFSLPSPSPQLNYDGTEGDWRTVPDALLYRIRELPVLCANAEALIRYVHQYVGDVRAQLECRKYQYARIGLFALFAAAKLHRECGLPTPRDTDSRTVFSVLWRWRRHLWRLRLKQIPYQNDI